MSKDEAQLLPKGAYWALAVLTTLNIINVWHRYLIYNLSAVSVEDCDVCDDVSFIPLCFIDEITSSTSEEDCLVCRNSYDTAFYNLKDGACIDNTEYGILAGIGFTLMFAMATLLAGRLTDTLDRRLLHTGAILVWSIAAAAHGMCTCFTCLLIARIFLGIGEAFNAPACYALITLYFPHSRRATANGFYSTGTYLGSAMSSLCLAVAVLIGWRNTAFLSGACGVLAGAILFFTVEHNPVMPPSSAGYTSLPDDSPKVGNVAGTPAIGSLSGYQVPSVVRRKMLQKGTVYAGDSNSGGGAASRGGGGGPPTPILSPSASSKERGYLANTPGGGALAGFAGPDVGTGGDPSLAYFSSEDDEGETALLLGVESKPKRRHGAPAAAGGRGFGRKGAEGVEEKPTGNPFAPGFDSSAVAPADGGNPDWGWYVENPSGTGGHGCRDGFDGVRGSDGGGAGGGGGGGRAGTETPRKSHDLRQALRTIASNRVVLLLFAASSARMVATWSIASYLAIYFHRAFPSQTSLFSIYNAVFLAIGGVSSSWGGGAFTDRLRVYNEGVLGYLPALGSLAAIFPVAVVLFSTKFSVAVTGLFFTYFVGECWLGPGMALLQVELPKELAGTSVAILLFLNSVFCNVGPWFIMWQDDGLSSVNRPLFATLFASYLSSFFLFSAVGFMVSQRQRQRRSVLKSVEAAGLLENGIGREGAIPGEKPSSLYTRHSARSCEGNDRRRSSSGGNICEMVRRTFSSGARRTTPWSNDSYLHDGGDRRSAESLGSGFGTRVSSGGRHESSVGLLDKNKNGVSSNASAKTGTAATEVGEREALLMGSWSSGMANGRRG